MSDIESLGEAAGLFEEPEDFLPPPPKPPFARISKVTHHKRVQIRC